jgi:hypothetical protein
MFAQKARKPQAAKSDPSPKAPAKRLSLGVGARIVFMPTGEQLHIRAIEGDQITFEKLP